MHAIRKLFGLSVYMTISSRTSFLLSTTLFAILIVAYICIAELRHAVNPDDKLFPTLSQLIAGALRIATFDAHGNIMLWTDTVASMRRFVLGMFIGSSIAISMGMLMGLFPIGEAFFERFVTFLGKVPPLAMLPIVFVVVGIDEPTKILLIVMGIFPPIARDTYFRVKALPKEQLVKALTLGATPAELVIEFILPQIMPSALNAVRLNLLNGWLFLIAGEAIAADAGLGYRIFLVRRYLAMDTIIPYVIWIAASSSLIDELLAWWIRFRYSWYEK